MPLINEPFEFQFDSDTFFDFDDNKTLTFEAKIYDPEGLDELKFDHRNHKITGMMTKLRTYRPNYLARIFGYVPPIYVNVTARDIADKQVTDFLVIRVAPSWNYLLRTVATYLGYGIAGIGMFKYRDEIVEILCRQ